MSKKLRYGLFLIGLLVVIFSGLFIAPQLLKTRPSVLNPRPTPANIKPSTLSIPPTLNPTETSELQEQAKNDRDFQKNFDAYTEKVPLIYLMPVQTENFLIDYEGDTVYSITLFGADREKARQDALNWWRSNNVDPQILNIVWK